MSQRDLHIQEQRWHTSLPSPREAVILFTGTIAGGLVAAGVQWSCS
jgi:hypothetical protein